MSDDNPPPLPPRPIMRQHIPGHTDHSTGLQQQELQMWPQLSFSQAQPAGGIQAVPVGLGFHNNRPQQQIWPDHSPAYSQRAGWQPLPHTQQSPQESQELNQPVVRPQHQNWPGEVNPLQLQQLQQVIMLQQQQQQQQHLQQQVQQQQHHTDQPLHHMDPISTADDTVHDKFTKSPSPQIEENRRSPALSRQFVQNVTSPQQQMWQHAPVMQQYEIPHNENAHSQAAFQPNASHHQPLFTQQPYIQQVQWQHSPYSQVQLQHMRQSTPQMQQHFIWQQQQQQQLQQHQLQQQQHQPHLHNDPPPPYSPPHPNLISKAVTPEKKDLDIKSEQSAFMNSRISIDPMRNDKFKTFESPGSQANSSPFTPSAPSFTPPVFNQNTNNPTPVKILTKANQSSFNLSPQQNSNFSQKSTAPSFSTSPVSVTSSQQNVQQNFQPVSSALSQSSTNQLRPQNFNPNPGSAPFQNLNTSNNNKPFPGMMGNQNRFPSPAKETVFNHSQNQFRPRSQTSMRNHVPPFQRNNTLPPSVHSLTMNDRIEVHIFVKGLNPSTRETGLINYFEVVGMAPVKDKVLFGLDHTEALVTFKQRLDMTKMRHNIQRKRLDGHTVSVFEMPLTKAIVVSGEKEVSPESLRYYFERDTIGGGSLKKDGGIDETEDGCSVLEFQDYRVISRLCNGQQHRVDKVLLRVSPYYQCSEGAIWDNKLHIAPIPKPVNIHILPDQLQFVEKHCKPQFSAKLRDKYADVSFSRDHVTVRCTLHQAMHTYRTLVRSWESGVQEAVAKFLGEHIDQADVEIQDVVWDKVLDWMNTNKHEFKDFLMKPDSNRKRLKLVGMKVNMKTALAQIKLKQEALLRVARRKSETRKVKSVEKLQILEVQGTFGNICKKFSDLKMRRAGQEITVEGDPDDIMKAFIDVYSECDKIEPACYKHSKCREYVDFAKKESSRKFIQRKMEQQMLKGSWSITGTELNVFTPKNGKPDQIRAIVVDSIQMQTIEVDKSSTSLLHSEVWGDFLIDLLRRYKDKVEIHTKKLQTVVVVGTNDVVVNVVKQLKDFLDEKTSKTVTVSCEPVSLEYIDCCWTDDDYAEIQKCDVVIRKKGNGMELTGLSENLIAAKQKLDIKLKRICSKKHQLRRTGIRNVLEVFQQRGSIGDIEKEFRCLVKLPPQLDQAPLSSTDMDMEELPAHPEETPSQSGPKCFTTKRHKIKIRLVQGEIGAQKADILVCSSNASLNLKSGSASYSLVRHGGPQIQSFCETRYPNGIKLGEVALIDKGGLACDKVYLTALPPWKEAASNGGKVLSNFLQECLRLANKYSKKSLAFQSLGTGYLGYPRDIVASLMYRAVVEFDRSYSSTSLQDIAIVLYHSDKDTIRAFEDHEHTRLYGSQNTGPLVSDFLNGRLRIELAAADLSKQKVDCLLCSVSPDMNLTRSAICKSLIQHGGSSIQTECKNKYGNDLAAGKIADVGSGDLPCKSIFLTVLSPYTQSNQADQGMKATLKQALQLASTKGFKSIAIPSLGTGYLNYPKTTSAQVMYDAVLEWAQKSSKSSLKLIKFIMYSKDTEAQQAFRVCHAKSQGRERRLSRHFVGDGTVPETDESNSKYKMVTDGCVLGPVQLNVKVGDILDSKAEAIVNGVGNNFDMTGAIAQALAKRCPNIIPECQNKKVELKKEGVAMTSSAGLSSQYIIHVQFQETLVGWKNKMVTCLEEAEKKGLKSVAFPLLGAGQGSKIFKPESIAECIFNAVDIFVGKHSNPSAVEVDLVIHERNQVFKPTILSALQMRTTQVLSEWPFGKKIKHKFAGLLDKIGINSQQGLKNPAAKQKALTELSSLQVVVYSDKIINIDHCIKALDDRVGLEYMTRSVDVDPELVKALTDSQIDNIIDNGIIVDVKFDKKTCKYNVSGAHGNVLSAVVYIMNKLRQYVREKENRVQAESLFSMVRWHYEVATASDLKEEEYTLMPNYTIEMAYKAGKANVELSDTAGVVYVIDFNKLVEFPKSDRTDTVRVIRKDILKGAQAQLPTNWSSMSGNENVKRVTLSSSDSEYQQVEKLFKGQVQKGPYAAKIRNNQNLIVNKIERIQNKLLYQQYSARKKLMEQQKSSLKVPLERQLWHGTADTNLNSIISNGFNRSYCGTHGVNHGQGVYFAADASYSAQSYLTNSTAGTKKHMFLVKVLTGETNKGTPSMRVLSPVDSAKPHILYDSAVDKVNSPMEFVIFHDTQAYPEYLITFTI